MEKITVETTVHLPCQKVWDFFTKPEHIVAWNHASADWHSPRAENHVEVGGTFNYRMESVDGSEGFDFTGTYSEVVPCKLIVYTMDGEDKREVRVEFIEEDGTTRIIESFDPENENSLEMQRGGWQAILDTFTRYAESHT